MDDLELFGKLPKAAEELGKSAVAIEHASGNLSATLLKLKESMEANREASTRLREIIVELTRRAAKRESKEGGKR